MELISAIQGAIERGLTATDPKPLTYELLPDAINVIESLERQGSGIELLNVIRRQDRILATVRLPPKKQRIIEAILDRYAHQDDRRSGRPKHQNLVESIEHLRLATENDLWTDTATFPDLDASIWWEVWLYHNKRPPTNKSRHLRFHADILVWPGSLD